MQVYPLQGWMQSPQHLLQVNPLQGWMQSPQHLLQVYPLQGWMQSPQHLLQVNPLQGWMQSPQHLLQVYPLQGWMQSPQHLLQVYPLQGWMQSPDHSRNTYYKCTLFKDGCRARITPATPTTSLPSSRMDAEPGSLPQHLLQVYPLQGWMQHLLQVYPLQGWMQHLLQVYPLQGRMQSPDHSRNTYYKCTLFKDGCNTYYKCTLFKDGCRARITPATPTTSVPSSRMDAEPGSLLQHLLQVYPLQGWMQSPDHSRLKRAASLTPSYTLLESQVARIEVHKVKRDLKFQFKISFRSGIL